MAGEQHRPGVQVVVLLASAGGLDAISAVLGDLPTGFGAAVIVQQHLGGQSSVLPTILRRSTVLPVDWARSKQPLQPGQVVVCPPDMHIETGLDACCRLRPMRSLAELRFDVLLSSVAASYGPRGLAVVLSGSGRDGTRGVAAMKHAGAVVIAQSPDSAEYPSMPMAAVEAGADLVLAPHEIGSLLASIVEGAPLPGPATEFAVTTWRKKAIRRDGVGPLPVSRTLDSAAARAEAARRRAAELQRRRQDLAAGLGATAQSVATARRRAEESLRRAQQAQQAARRAATRPAD